MFSRAAVAPALLVVLLAACAAPTFAMLPFHAARLTERRMTGLRHAADPAALPAMPPAHFHTTAVDHFDAMNTHTYSQRFYVNTTFWDAGGRTGPVFLYIEGEAAASPMDVLVGEHMALAAVHNALVFAVEHRYYGASVPVPNMEPQNMQFLSSEQALADLATFHAFATMEYNLTKSQPWIAFGGSYPGALTAWIRVKYPHLIYASVASSAPVQAVENFVGYNEVVHASLSAGIVGGSAECATNTATAFSTIDKLVSTPEGVTTVTEKFNTCKPVTTANDTLTFVSNLSNNFQETVQYNAEIPGSPTIKDVCGYMTNSANDPLTNLAQMTAALYSKGECMDNSYADSNAGLFNTTVNIQATGVGIRQWIYQTCTQFGYYQTCDSNTDCPFSTLQTLASNVDLCYDAFGIDASSIPRRIAFSNDYYGGNQPAGSRILFVNGSIDPWHWLSVYLKPLSATETTVFINGTAHCANMMPASPNDPPNLVAARVKIAAQVSAWLADAAVSSMM